MYYYFHVRFKEDNDIYIIRVETEIVDKQRVMDQAVGIMVNKTKRLDFEIKEATIESILSQATFVENIMQFKFI